MSSERNPVGVILSERVLIILANATGIAINELRGRDLNSRYKKSVDEYNEWLRKENSVNL